jgi:hypothetical protein
MMKRLPIIYPCIGPSRYNRRLNAVLQTFKVTHYPDFNRLEKSHLVRDNIEFAFAGVSFASYDNLSRQPVRIGVGPFKGVINVQLNDRSRTFHKRS